jgi:hypothetical protein
MMDNIFIRTDPAGNIKADKEKSTEKIDGAIATIMALDRAIRWAMTMPLLSMTAAAFFLSEVKCMILIALMGFLLLQEALNQMEDLI